MRICIYTFIVVLIFSIGGRIMTNDLPPKKLSELYKIKYKKQKHDEKMEKKI